MSDAGDTDDIDAIREQKKSLIGQYT